LLVGGDEDSAIGDDGDDVRIAACVGPGASDAAEELRESGAGRFSIEGVERNVGGTVVGGARDGPDDDVVIAVAGDGGEEAAILTRAKSGIRAFVGDGKGRRGLYFPEIDVGAAAADDARAVMGKIRWAAPTSANVHFADEFIGTARSVTAEIVAIEDEHAAVFASGGGEMRGCAGKIGKKESAARTVIVVGSFEAGLIGRSEEAEDGSEIGGKFDDTFLNVGDAVVGGAAVIGIAGNEKEIAGRIGGDTAPGHPDGREEETVRGSGLGVIELIGGKGRQGAGFPSKEPSAGMIGGEITEAAEAGIDVAVGEEKRGALTLVASVEIEGSVIGELVGSRNEDGRNSVGEIGQVQCVKAINGIAGFDRIDDDVHGF